MLFSFYQQLFIPLKRKKVLYTRASWTLQKRLILVITLSCGLNLRNGPEHQDVENFTRYVRISQLCSYSKRYIFIYCSKCVRQGCNLSPLLFSLVISYLEDYLVSNNSGYITIDDQKIHLVLFADDMVLLLSPEVVYKVQLIFLLILTRNGV